MEKKTNYLDNVVNLELDLIKDQGYFYISYEDYYEIGTREKINLLGKQHIKIEIRNILFDIYSLLNKRRERETIYFYIFLTDDDNEKPLKYYEINGGRKGDLLVLRECKEYQDIEE